jgi:hypothetical protein
VGEGADPAGVDQLGPCVSRRARGRPQACEVRAGERAVDLHRGVDEAPYAATGEVANQLLHRGPGLPLPPLHRDSAGTRVGRRHDPLPVLGG